MTFGIEHFVLASSVIVFVGIILGKVGARFGVPALLLFLFTGMLFGVDGVGIAFDNAKMVQNIGMIALAIILFTGGMDTKLKEIKPVLTSGIVLSTIGVLLTTIFTGLFIYLITNNFSLGVVFSLPLSLLLAATMSSTDSASVFAILRSQRVHLREDLKPMLELESGSNDPMAYMLTLVLIEYITHSSLNVWDFIGQFAMQFLIGGGAGIAFGWLSVWVINRINIPNRTLYPIVLLCTLFFSFTVTTLLHGNGYLTVYIAGIYVGNNRLQHRGSINHFFDGITWLVQIVLFILLGLLVNPHEMPSVLLLAVLISLFMMFLGRPLACHLSLLPFRKLSFKAKGFLSWVGLRGAAPIIFATYPVVSEVSEANHIFSIVFTITLLSLLFQGMTITPVARFLGLATPAPPEGNFMGVEMPEDMGTQMEEREVNAAMLSEGDELREIPLKREELVILVRRKNRFIVPKGQLKLHVGDILLVVSQHELPDAAPTNAMILFERIRKSLLNQR